MILEHHLIRDLIKNIFHFSLGWFKIMKKTNKFLALLFVLSFVMNSQKEILADKTNLRKFFDKTEEISTSCLDTVKKNKLGLLSILTLIGSFVYNRYSSSKYKEEVKKLEAEKSKFDEQSSNEASNELEKELENLNKEKGSLDECLRGKIEVEQKLNNLKTSKKSLQNKIDFLTEKNYQLNEFANNYMMNVVCRLVYNFICYECSSKFEDRFKYFKNFVLKSENRDKFVNLCKDLADLSEIEKDVYFYGKMILENIVSKKNQIESKNLFEFYEFLLDFLSNCSKKHRLCYSNKDFEEFIYLNFVPTGKAEKFNSFVVFLKSLDFLKTWNKLEYGCKSSEKTIVNLNGITVDLSNIEKQREDLDKDLDVDKINSKSNNSTCSIL